MSSKIMWVKDGAKHIKQVLAVPICEEVGAPNHWVALRLAAAETLSITNAAQPEFDLNGMD